MKWLLIGALAGLAVTGKAYGEDHATLAPTVEAGARKALAAMATRQWSGGWANGWNIDGRLVLGEHNIIPHNALTVQPPATPAIGQVYVRAAAVLDEPVYLHHARLARKALAGLQTREGGFPHEGVPTGRPARGGTFDDDTTTGALTFLLAYAHATGDEAAWDMVRKTGEFILAAQYEDSGGWPQVYPIQPNAYSRHITFNDHVMTNAIRACMLLHEELEDERFFEAAKRGGDCIVMLQGGPGEAVWAQQHDAETFAPAPARAFEPAAYTAGESRAVLEVLVDLYLATGDGKYLEPLPKAFDWYEERRLPNGLWARFYEPGTHRPIYGDRDGQVYYNLEEISEERQRGYSWEGNYYPERAYRDYAFIQEHGREALIAQRAATSEPDPDRLATQAREIVARLSAEGWWTENAAGRIRTLLEQQEIPEDAWQVVTSRTFVRNMNTLLDYLDAVKAAE